MSFIRLLQARVEVSGSRLCVGLDPVLERLPEHLPKSLEGVRSFLEQIIRATAPHAAAFKPNFAYFEALGPAGLELLQEVIRKIPEAIPVIGDAKRGDIGSSSEQYARAIFEQWGCHAVTVSPYMGTDSLEPFMARADRGVFVLCLTSNPGAEDFQLPGLYLQVARKVRAWNTSGNLGLVVGATRPETIGDIRAVSGPMPFLIPGVGAQGGALEATLHQAQDETSIPCLINASRSLLYASSGEDFAQAAGVSAEALAEEIAAVSGKAPSSGQS